MTGRRSFLAAVLACGVLAACSSSEQAGEPSSSPARNATSAPLLPTEVAALPDMDVGTYEELIAQLRGTPLVVNFWASWCVPCEDEAPLLKAAAIKHGDEVQFLGVDILDSRDGARGFIERHGLPYPSVFDPAGSIRTALGHLGQPVTVFYDRDGNVVREVDGQIGENDLRRGIASIL